MIFFRWEDAKRAYLKFIDNEIFTRHITRIPCTLRYTYSYTLIYTKTRDCSHDCLEPMHSYEINISESCYLSNQSNCNGVIPSE